MQRGIVKRKVQDMCTAERRGALAPRLPQPVARLLVKTGSDCVSDVHIFEFLFTVSGCVLNLLSFFTEEYFDTRGGLY